MDFSLWATSAANSLKLVLGACAVALVVGTLTSVAAWRSGHAAGRLLPVLSLAVPPYVFVLCLSEVSEYLSPWAAAIGVLGLCNSAFVHAPMVSILSRVGDDLYEAALVATGSRARALLHVLRPAMRSALPLGLIIVGCEALSDLAVSRYYGIQTSVVLTFTIWNATIAVERIIRGLVLLVLIGLLFSSLGRRFRSVPLPARRLVRRPLLALLAALPSLAMIAFCAVTLLRWMSGSRGLEAPALLAELGNSGVLVGSAAGGCALVALAMALLGSSPLYVRANLFLYGLPALVLAVLLLPLTRWLPCLLVLLGAILLRFSCLMVVSMDTVIGAHQRLAEMLRASTARRERLGHLVRLYSPGLMLGLCLVAVDVLRELPMTMVLQPLNFTTLSMRISYLAGTEMLSAIAPEAMVLFSVSLVVTLVLVSLQHALSA